MAKPPASHDQGLPGHESVLLGVVALAGLFSNCVEAFGLIHPAHKWDKTEQLLLTKLGLQQARLLIWGDMLGITSPPKTVTDRAVPRHPSPAYPDLKEPTFFAARDLRLDEPGVRARVEAALNAIVDRAGHLSREQMMERYGLKPPRRVVLECQPALDTNRLEGLREKFELLQEVAETYARLNMSRRADSIVQTSWVIADTHRFGTFIRLVQEQVDFLIEQMGVKEGVDRGMRMDIRGLGWHLSADRVRVAQDTSKLRLIREACEGEYPEYVAATQQALENIEREQREHVTTTATAKYNPYAASDTTTAAEKCEPPPSPPQANGAAQGREHKRPGLLTLLRSFRKSKDSLPDRRSAGTSASAAVSSSPAREPERSQSDSGPTTRGTAEAEAEADTASPLAPIRSKSVGAIQSVDGEVLRNRLARRSRGA